MAVYEFTGQYRFLSNFWSCYILYDEEMFPSVENAYQAAKCADKSDHYYFRNCKASEAKRKGQIIVPRGDWERVKLDVMYELVRQKFTEYPILGDLLRNTPGELQEGNWWGDTFWGTVNGKGQNHLGKILMRVRNELRELTT